MGAAGRQSASRAAYCCWELGADAAHGGRECNVAPMSSDIAELRAALTAHHA
jgi:hypothetical protein